jgi:hypothetical protein
MPVNYIVLSEPQQLIQIMHNDKVTPASIVELIMLIANNSKINANSCNLHFWKINICFVSKLLRQDIPRSEDFTKLLRTSNFLERTGREKLC